MPATQSKEKPISRFRFVPPRQSSSPPCPAQPQPASATQSGQSTLPPISTVSNWPHRSHAASALTGLAGLDSTIFV